MRIGLLINHWPLMALLEPWIKQGWLVGLATQEGKNELVTGVKMVSQTYNIPYAKLTKKNLYQCLSEWLETTRPDVVLVSTFSYKIPGDLLQIPRFGFFNFHYGLLPGYRGPDTIFWPIRNQETWGGFTVHKMDADWDTGAIAYTQPIAIESEDTYGIYLNKIGQILPQVATKLIDDLSIHGNSLNLISQDAKNAHYWSQPGFEDLCIRWEEQSAKEIHALVRASNPKYGGAIAFLRGIPLHILQVSLIESKNYPALQPGEIAITNTHQDMVVCCQDGSLLSLDAVQTSEGIFTGDKLSTNFGLKTGEILSIPDQFQRSLTKQNSMV